MAKNNAVNNILSAVVFLAVLLIILFSACYMFKAQCGIDIVSKITGPKPQPTTIISVVPTQSSLITTSYRGNLPCADCPGLDTELILKKISPDSIDGTFVTKETYLERNVNPIITHGTWRTLFSSVKGKPTVIIQLNSSTPKTVRYFLKVSDTELRMLDNNKAEIVGNPNVTLKKINN